VTEHLVAFTGGEAGCVVVPVRGTVDDADVLVDGGGCYFGGSAGAGYAF
jgi:hypothetical protein